MWALLKKRILEEMKNKIVDAITTKVRKTPIYPKNTRPMTLKILDFYKALPSMYVTVGKMMKGHAPSASIYALVFLKKKKISYSSHRIIVVYFGDSEIKKNHYVCSTIL